MIKSIFAALLLLASAAVGAQERGTPIDSIVAVVNEDIVLHSELESRVVEVMRSISQSGTEAPPANVVREQVLDRIIIERLQLQRAEQSGIGVSEDRLNQAMATVAQRNGLTLPQFTEALAAEGFSYEQVRNDVRNDMIITQLRQRDVLERVNVSKREVDGFLAGEGAGSLDDREFLVSHIMLRVDSDAPATEVDRVRVLGESLIAQARAGEEFATLAVAHSQGQQALEGGDLGWRRSTQLPAVFAERVVSMETGAVSDLIRTPGAFHIIKLVDQRGSSERLVVQQTRARHILVRNTPVMTDGRAVARLSELRQKILDGADFGEVARLNSEDSGSAVNDGDLGWLQPGQTVPAFEQALERLDIGEVSEPISTQFGWHIVQVLERRAHDSTDQAREAQAFRILRERKAEEQIEVWLQRMLDEAYVEKRLDA
ncbi:MAG: peptidylprolyl isomerase [Gammaproteobacteria bacterium]